MEKQKKQIKKYRKGTLRKRLEKEMQRNDPKFRLSNKQFARWFGIYCDMTGKSDEIRNAKMLEEPEVDQLSAWLGYPLR